MFYYKLIQENSLVDETNHTASVFTKVIWLYINFVKIADSKIPCKFFVPTSKSYSKATMHDMRKGDRTWKLDTRKRKWQWEYIKNYYYSMTILPRSTNSIGWQLYLVVKNAENSVYSNIMQLLYDRANMIPPFKVSKSGVQTDYPLG